MPFASVGPWRFVPGLQRSVECGPAGSLFRVERRASEQIVNDVDPIPTGEPVVQLLLWASYAPAFCRSRKRRLQVMLEPHPIICGSNSQDVPERGTKKMPVDSAKSDGRKRPPFGLAGSSGSNGAITVHRPLGRRGLIILPQRGTTVLSRV